MKRNQVKRRLFGYLEINPREDLIPYFDERFKKFKNNTSKDEFWVWFKEMFAEKGLSLSQTEELIKEIYDTNLSYRSKEASAHLNKFKHVIPSSIPLQGGSGGSLR